ncbi:ABC transporter substrate-binding protein [Nonomuraea soli]|uniref:NitT/TauT family transport system substrate-binding protein n=1 Tax=Nonomuraea soli TaxID=1032476 RepID=A0A7W0HS38_9ACTN|nr:ABC transporter substrate-binding protein [Nonomuraea soli]MBA2893261.1 NitT/TauT family transport system substrate-binding protein [Nonomuraea soli]
MRWGAVLAGLTLVVSACAGPDSGSGPERTELRVAVLPTPDAAPLYIALQRSFFEEEGLTVKAEIVDDGTRAVPRLAAGELDLAIADYMTVFDLVDKGARLRVVADASQAGTGTAALMAQKDSGVTTIRELRGMKVAAPAGISTLLVEVTLKANGMEPDDVTMVRVPYPDHPRALSEGRADASNAWEPYVTAVEKAGGIKLADTVAGPTADFPVAGWVASDDWAAQHPRTMAAFQRALLKAQKLAAGDRRAVQDVLPTYTRIDAATAAAMVLPAYPITLDVKRVQRVADFMAEFGHLKARLDVAPLMAQQPPQLRAG